MINIHDKTLQDLEFYTVLQQVSEYCVTALGKTNTLQIKPLKEKESLITELNLTNEYLSSFYNDNHIPNHGFEPITKELKILKIENTYLEVYSLKKLVSISLTTNEIVNYLIKFVEYYPALNRYASHIEVTKAIIEKVDAIIDRFGDIKTWSEVAGSRSYSSIIVSFALFFRRIIPNWPQNVAYKSFLFRLYFVKK